jgi:hypothetical protein
MAALITTVASATGMPFGIVAGQAWECEPRVALSDYQRAKTGALFAAATAAGAQAAGGDPVRWRALGDRLGEAYQFADDIRDVLADPEVRQRLEAMGISAVGVDQARPEALRAHLKNEIDTLGGLLVKAGVKAN